MKSIIGYERASGPVAEFSPVSVHSSCEGGPLKIASPISNKKWMIIKAVRPNCLPGINPKHARRSDNTQSESIFPDIELQLSLKQ